MCFRSFLSRLRQGFRAHPFSIMALGNSVGDCCYLGFAFYAHHGLSGIKIAGALSAIIGQILLLAYADDQARKIEHEQGRLAVLLLSVRAFLKKLLRRLIRERRLSKPIFCGFAFLAMNGLALLAEAMTRRDPASLSQIFLGVTIFGGCMTFAMADWVDRQRTADFLTKIAPTILVGSTFGNIALSVTSWNPFIVASTGCFAVANIAGYFTRIEKEPLPVESPSRLP